MSHSSNHFLTLDATKKPKVRKGVSFQSYVPPVLPGSEAAVSRSGQLNKVHVAIDARVHATMERVSKTLPDMGPFNIIAPELAVEYLEAQARAMKDDVDSGSKPSTYWDTLEESLDQMVKEETMEDDVAPKSSTFSLDALRGLLSRLEAWNERAIKATLGTGQVLSTEVDELLEESRIIEQRVQLPLELLKKLRILQSAGESFANKVRSKLTLKGKEKVPLPVLTNLMSEAEILPIETEEVRFFRNQRGRLQALCHSADKAAKDKSLEKSKDVTIEAAEIRAILPDLDIVKTQVSMAEWVQKAMAKTDKKSSVPLQTIEQLFEDPSAALIKPEDCDIMQVLQKAMNEGRAWHSKANKMMAGLPSSSESRSSIKVMPSVEGLQALLDEHSKLGKVCVPTVSSNVEGLLRRAKAWMKKQERTLSGTWSIVDAKSLLEEGRQLSAQVDLNPQFSELVREVTKAEDWCSRARTVMNSLALTDIDQLQPLVNSSFKVKPLETPVEESEGPLTKRARRAELSSNLEYGSRLRLNAKELQALRNYENSLAELTATYRSVEHWLRPLLASGKLPTQNALVELRDSLGIVRDLNLEADITQLCEAAIKWGDRADAVVKVSFPRPAGALRSLATLLHELAANPMQYEGWDEIIKISHMEIWAHQMRYAELPISEAALSDLVRTCPFNAADFEAINDVEKALELDRTMAACLPKWQDEWMKQVLGLNRERASDEVSALKNLRAINDVVAKYCQDLLTPRRKPMHCRRDADSFMNQLLSMKSLSLMSLMSKVEVALNRNSALEDRSRHLCEKLALDFSGSATVAGIELFKMLLDLLEDVENAELKVENFNQSLTPLVGKLLQYQASVRAVFKWDMDEAVTESGFRPSLQDVESLWNQMSLEAARDFKLSENFLKSVAYLSSCTQALRDAYDWRNLFAEYIGHLRKRTDQRVGLMTVKRQAALWHKIPTITPYNDIVTDAELASLDDWEQDVATIMSGKKQKPRSSLSQAENLLKRAPSPICVHSMDFESLASEVNKAQGLRQSAFDVITRSYVVRAGPSDAESEMSGRNIFKELTQLETETKQSLIDPGTLEFIEIELSCRNMEQLMASILSRPQVVPVELVDEYLRKVDSWDREIENHWANPHDRRTHLKGIEFAPSKTLKDTVAKRIADTIKFKHMAAEFIGHLHEPPVRKPTTPADHQNLTMAQVQSAISSALNAPPTAAGEKILDIVLRSIVQDLAPIETFLIRKDPIPQYVFPLPLYQLPPSSQPSTPVATASSSGGRRGGKSASAIQPSVPPENPLLIKGLSPMHQLLYQVPWTRQGMGYLSPLNDVLMRKPTDWVVAEKERFRERISRPGLSLQSALELLVIHKRGSLFQTPEYVRIRQLSAISLRTVRTCMNRFAFLAARNKHEEADFPLEVWERVLQPTGQPGDLDEGQAATAVASTSAAGSKSNEELELVSLLLQLESLALQVPTKFRLLMLFLDMYDWRVKAQALCHHMPKLGRPRPWAGDDRSLELWKTMPACADIFQQKPIAQTPQLQDPLCIHPVPSPPPKEYILCSMHMSFYYVIECSRHFIRVMSDMCELCYDVTTTEQENVFWISCDGCDKWYHVRCAGVSQQTSTFTCQYCVMKNPNLSAEKKRIAMNHLNSLPQRKFQIVDAQVRMQEAGRLLAEGRQHQIITTVNPVELGIFRRLGGPNQ